MVPPLGMEIAPEQMDKSSGNSGQDFTLLMIFHAKSFFIFGNNSHTDELDKNKLYPEKMVIIL